MVWNAFWTYGLLLWHATQPGPKWGPLILPHHGTHRTRFKAALTKRNDAMIGTGQPLYAHACNLCEEVIYAPATETTPKIPIGRLRVCHFLPPHSNTPPERYNACITDGVTMGHTRCNVTSCLEELDSVRDRFCPLHRDKELICSMPDCNEPARPKFRTCTKPEHTAYELKRHEQGMAYMRLRKCIKTTSAGSAIRVFSSDGAELQALDDPELFTEIENLVPPKPSKKNPPEKSPAARSMLTR